MNYRRYSAIERGELELTATEIVGLCELLGTSSDALLFGESERKAEIVLRESERKIVEQLVNWLQILRATN